MTASEVFFVVLCALVALLVTATALGTWLESRETRDDRLYWIQELNQRIRATWAIVPLFALAFLLGGKALTLIFALASFLALREFIALTPIKPSDHWALVVAFYLVIPLQYVLVAGGWYGWYAVFIPVYVFLLLPVIIALKRDNELYLQRVAKVQWGLMICVYCVSHAPAIATMDIAGYQGREALLLLYFLLVLQLSELAQVAATAFFGKTTTGFDARKSREGVLIGGGAVTVLGSLLWWMTPFAWWQALLMSLAIVVAGVMGSLVLNSVKSSLGVQELAHQTDELQLMRGTLDRLAALSFAAPVFFHLTLYFFAS